MNQRYRVLVTPQALAVQPQSISETLTEGEGFDVEFTGGPVHDRARLKAWLSDKHAAILGVERIDADVLAATPELRLLARFGVGYDCIDLAAAGARGVRVAVTPNLSSPAVARHTVALVLALLHNLGPARTSLAAEQWDRRLTKAAPDTVLGIAGLGSIGLATATLAARFGFRVAYWARAEKPEVREAGFLYCETFDALIEAADVISLHLKADPSLDHLVNARRLRATAGKFLVNTARGSLVDEAALLTALDAGTLSGAALDVFEVEPVRDISARLAAHPLVVATPHVASFDTEAVGLMGRAAADNVRYFSRGQFDRVRVFVG